MYAFMFKNMELDRTGLELRVISNKKKKLPLTCQLDVIEQVYITHTVSQMYFKIILGWVFGKMLLRDV